MYPPYVLMVIIPVALGIANLATALAIRKRTLVRPPSLPGLLRPTGYVAALWAATCVCWLLSAYPFIYGLGMGRAGAQLPVDYENAGEVLFFYGFGNLWWLVIILALDVLLVIALRRRRDE